MTEPFPAAFLWTSDLHLDHVTDAVRENFAEQLRRASGTPMVVSGDISVAARIVADLEFLADASDRPVWFVLGNHDHFGATISRVRDAVIELARRRPDIQWLPPAGVVPLGAETVLVGIDGWADGRHGDPIGTPLRLNDDRLIGELSAQTTRAGRLAIKRALADADGARLATLLDRAALAARFIVVATHIPPFPELLPASGRLAGVEWLPLLVCEATGTVLRDAARRHPQLEFLVLAGHTHVESDIQLLPNLRCRIASARYGEPALRSVVIPWQQRQ